MLDKFNQCRIAKNGIMGMPVLAHMKEHEIWNKNFDSWLETREGQWVWIHDTATDFFPCLEDAVTKAYEAGFSDRPIFVKQILRNEVPLYIAGLNHRYQWAG